MIRVIFLQMAAERGKGPGVAAGGFFAEGGQRRIGHPEAMEVRVEEGASLFLFRAGESPGI